VSEQRPGGRLDPPLSLILDEAASIALINDLPQKVSDTGGRGLTVMVTLQTMPRCSWPSRGPSRPAPRPSAAIHRRRCPGPRPGVDDPAAPAAAESGGPQGKQ
jgi:hypothetical protein